MRSSPWWRCFEVAASIAGLLMAVPLMGAAAAAIWLEDGGPVFFRQTRVGRWGERFSLLKLRSMRSAAGPLLTSAGDQRVTRVGRLLRYYKLDELPQLWNVVRGDMSLVGPRPEVPAYVDMGDEAWQQVLRYRPGITDLATLVYRNEEQILAESPDPERLYREVMLPTKLSLNRAYLDRSSWRTDLRLIMLSLYFSIWPAGFDPNAIRTKFLAGGTPR